MPAPKTGTLSAILLGSGGDSKEEESEGESLSAKGRALKDFFDAGKRGDWAAAETAFQDAHDAAMGHEDEGELLETEE